MNFLLGANVAQLLGLNGWKSIFAAVTQGPAAHDQPAARATSHPRRARKSANGDVGRARRGGPHDSNSPVRRSP